MKAYYIIPVIIYVVLPGLLVAGVIFSYRKKSTIFRCLVCLSLFLYGIGIGEIITTHSSYKRHQQRMAHEAGHLIGCTTMLRKGKTQKVIDALDRKISMKLTVSVSGRDMNKLPQEILAVWQEAKVYYDKYDVVGHSDPHITEIRNKLKQVPWSQRDAAERAFKAKYKGDNPQTAPELDIAKWFGPALSLTELRGKVVLLDFWGVWCAPCRKLLPHTQELYTKYNKMGLEVIGIHSSSRTENTAKFLSDNSLTFPIGIDDGNTASNYAVTGWPTYYLIDKEGYVVWGPEHDVPSDEQIGASLND